MRTAPLAETLPAASIVVDFGDLAAALIAWRRNTQAIAVAGDERLQGSPWKARSRDAPRSVTAIESRPVKDGGDTTRQCR